MSNLLWYLGRIEVSRFLPAAEASILKSVDIVD